MAQQQRERWSSRTAFIMAAVGSAVGLGNLWRFPAVAFENGGGAFFIPYLVALLTAGIPLMIVEYAIGQKYQGGAPKALAAVTSKFRWVGWFALLVGGSITTYYVVVMAYAWHYAAASFTVAWSKPAPAYEVKMEDGRPAAVAIPTENIRLYIPAADEDQKRKLVPVAERIPVLTEGEVAAKEKDEQVTCITLKDNVKNYFWQVCLGGFRPDYWGRARSAAVQEAPESRAPPPEAGEEAPAVAATAAADAPEPSAYVGDMFRLSPSLVVGALATWIMIFLIIFKGVRNVGKVVMLTVPLPVILLLIVVIRGVTLPGAVEGLIYYLKPNWELLKSTRVWIAAYGQIFFSLSLGFGILIAYASYMPPESDVTNSAFITSLANCATSFIAGLAVFSVLGYLAYVGGQQVSDVVAGGPGLVFQTYPIALSKMPMGLAGIGIISFLFFLCLITLGIDSAFSLVEGIVAGFRDRFPHITREVMCAIVCGVGFIGSLLFCTRSGLMWLDIVDNWMSNYGLPMVGLLECIAVGYFFHLDELKDYINEHSEIKLHYWFDAFIKVVTPGILIFLLGQRFLADVATVYEGYDGILAHSVTVAGWGWFLAVLCGALLLASNYAVVLSILGTVVLFLGFMGYLHWSSGQEWAALVGPSAMAAIVVAVLFGGLAACVRIAARPRRTTSRIARALATVTHVAALLLAYLVARGIGGLPGLLVAAALVGVLELLVAAILSVTVGAVGFSLWPLPRRDTGAPGKEGQPPESKERDDDAEAAGETPSGPEDDTGSEP